MFFLNNVDSLIPLYAIHKETIFFDCNGPWIKSGFNSVIRSEDVRRLNFTQKIKKLLKEGMIYPLGSKGYINIVGLGAVHFKIGNNGEYSLFLTSLSGKPMGWYPISVMNGGLEGIIRNKIVMDYETVRPQMDYVVRNHMESFYKFVEGQV